MPELPPVCPYCGLQTDTPVDHMWQRHRISPSDHQRNMDRIPQAAAIETRSGIPEGGYL